MEQLLYFLKFILFAIALSVFLCLMYWSGLLVMDRIAKRKVYDSIFEKGISFIKGMLKYDPHWSYYRVIDDKITYLYGLKYMNSAKRERLEVLNNQFRLKYKELKEEEICEFSCDSVLRK